MAKTPAPRRPVAMTVGKNESVTIRKIDNGFIVRKATERNGRFVETERFSPSNPLGGARKRGK